MADMGTKEAAEKWGYSHTKNQLKTVQKIEHNLAYMDYAKIFCLQFYWLLVSGDRAKLVSKGLDTKCNAGQQGVSLAHTSGCRMP